MVDRRGTTIAVTGAGRALGAAVVRLLAPQNHVVAIELDDIAGVPDEAEVRQVDVRDPLLHRSFEDVDTVIHLAITHSPDLPALERAAINVAGTASVLRATATARVRRLVIVTSAMVYGAYADNPVPIEDDAPLRAARDVSVVGDLIEIERQVEQQRSVGRPAVVVLRPATVVGPGADSVLTRHFESPRLLAVRGSPARWQFCHLQDLASACALAATNGLEGAYNVAPEGWIGMPEVERIVGRRRIELPPSIAFGAAERLHRIGLTIGPASELHFLAHPWVVSSGRLRAAGWQPVYDNAAALAAHLAVLADRPAAAGRRGPDATRAAAGATVALLGTAALVRRARRRRR